MKSKNNEKGYVFLLASIFIIAMISALILSNYVVLEESKVNKFLASNAENEIKLTYENTFKHANQSASDLNSNLFNSIYWLDRKASIEGHDFQACLIAFDLNNQFILINYWNQECNYYVDNAVQGTVNDNSSAIINVNNANATKIDLCDCNFDLIYDPSFRFKLNISKELDRIEIDSRNN